jgi:hypothetical protein
MEESCSPQPSKAIVKVYGNLDISNETLLN